MSIDIGRLAEQHRSPLAAIGANSAIQNFLDEQARWREQLLGPSYVLGPIQEYLENQERLADQHWRKLASASQFRIEELIDQTLKVGRMADALAPSKAFMEVIEQNQRLIDKLTRFTDPLQVLRDQLDLDRIASWASRMEPAAEHVKRLLDALPALDHAELETDWDALDEQWGGVQATIDLLPPSGATEQQLRAMGLSRAEWLFLFISVLGLLLSALSYLETRAQGRFARDQAALEQASDQRENREEKEYRERLLAAIEALAEHAPSQVNYYVVGLRSVRVKSSINKGTLIDTAHPNQIVLATGKNGRWLKIRYRNNMEEREVEGWVLKHYLIRQTGPGDDGAQE